MPVASQSELKTGQKIGCYHCGEDCPTLPFQHDNKHFCCLGCQSVYEILNTNDLGQFYQIEKNAGNSLKGKTKSEYAYLDAPEVVEKIIDFSNETQTKITFLIPQIHCASCIWLLENLFKLKNGILDSKVNFLKKEIYITFSNEQLSLRQVVELLESIGYAPAINLSDLDSEKRPIHDRSFLYKLGVAGFAFGNIMLLSFPEYLGLNQIPELQFSKLFGYLNILLALPLVFYSGRDYLKSAWLGLKQRNLNIDVPISLGILTLFSRSVFEILTQSGAGYLDSMAGLIFFLLIGKWFQQRTYHNLSFERDYKAYFPIAARKKTKEGEKSVTLDQLKPGDTIIIKNQELIPADSILLKGNAQIDFSFVTGESEPVHKQTGDKIFAGGRQMGDTIEISLIQKVSQSYLTQLWNDAAFSKNQDAPTLRLANRVGKYFTFAILLIAAATLTYWLPKNMGTAINAFTAVLIIACPCAVALAIPFIFGNVLRLFGRRHFYLKNTSIIEKLRNIQAVVFDKTGTLTNREKGNVQFVGHKLSLQEKQWIHTLVNQSNHPASLQISTFLKHQIGAQEREPLKLEKWEEVVGQGLEGTIEGNQIKVGSSKFIGTSSIGPTSGVHVQINGNILGHFNIENHLRKGISQVLNYFNTNTECYLLSGDNDREKELLIPLFDDKKHLLFYQSPQDKLLFIKRLQSEGKKVLMIGDGLNDAGALQQSDVGIVIAENTNNFTPACDAILQADQIGQLPKFMAQTKTSTNLVLLAYIFAVLYNIIGLSFAVQGALSPVIAAILMPLSSISIVLFGILSSNWFIR